MLFIIGIQAGTHSDIKKKRFSVLPEDKDILLLRNQPHHIIEGAGAAGMLLGETETDLRMRYGEPAYRDFASPETLTYTEQNFNASYVLKNGRIIEIRLEVEKHKTPSFEWFTALGLHESDITGMTSGEALKKLARYYGTARVRHVGDCVHILSRGIRFWFRGRVPIRVDVLEVEAYPD